MESNKELSVTSVISLFEMNKIERSSFVTRIVDAIDSGFVDALKIHVQVKNMEKIIEGLSEQPMYKKSVLESAQRYSSKKFDFHNASLEIKEVGVKYDYSQCNDPVLTAKMETAARISDEIKQRQKMLQVAPQSGLIITDEESGETFTVYPPSKSSTTAVQCTLK